MKNQSSVLLESIGDSIVLVADEDIVKVHVHTNEPGVAITKALTYGALTKMKIDNMREEHQEKLIKDAQKLADEQKTQKKNTPVELKEFGFVSVAAGKGLEEIFKDLGTDEVITGGQTMNPSAEDIINAIEKVPAKNVFVFPNNKNIILAANQAKELIDDKEVFVIPTMTIPQGITALVSFFPEKSAMENASKMQEEIKTVKTGQVTYAVRDTTIDQIPIHKNDFMGIGDNGLLSSGQDIRETTLLMAEKMIDEDSELISVYYGQDVTDEDADEICSLLEEKFPDCDVEIHNGGQPVYYYLISVE